MPSFPSRDFTNQFISTSYQDVLQQYIPGTGTAYILDGLGNVVFQFSASAIGRDLITSDLTASMTVLSSSYSQTASFALNAGGGSGTTLFTGSTYQITASWAINAITASFLNGNATGSFFGTSSWASFAISSSYALSSTFTDTASYAITSTFSDTASYAVLAESARTASFLTPGTYNVTSSWSINSRTSISSSWASQSLSSSYSLFAETASFTFMSSLTLLTQSNVATSASWASQSFSSVSSSWASASISASYAVTASFALNAGSSGGTTLFTGSTYEITSSWANNAVTASYLIYPSSLVTANNNTTTSLILQTSSVNNGIFINYILNDGGNFRAGNVVVIYNTSSVNLAETTTTDIGDSGGLTIRANISNTFVTVSAVNNTPNNFNIKYHYDIL